MLGRVRNDETPHEREQRRKRGEPYEEWVTVAPWQERAQQRHFPLLAAFQEHMRGELLADRGLDISAWPQQRSAANQGDVSATPGRETAP